MPSSPDLRLLLRLAFDRPAEWLLPPEAPIEVHWAALSLSEVRPGDLFLLPTHGQEPEALGQALHSAQQRGAAASLLLGAFPGVEHLLASSPAGLPLALAPAYADPRQAQERLLAALLNHRAALLERAERLQARLLQLSAEGRGLPALAHSLAEVSGRGVLVQDKRFNILAQASSLALADIWSGALDGLEAPDSLPEALRDRKQAGRASGVYAQVLPGGLERLVAAVTVSEVARGYLSLLGIAGEMDDLDRMVVDQGARVCALEMARLKALRESEKRLRGDLLSALMQETLSPNDARLWLENLSYDPDLPYLAVRFAWEGANPPSRRRLETLVNGELARLGLNGVASPLGAEMICFLPAPASGRPEQEIAFCQSVQNQGAKEQPRHAVRCGIGAPARELGTWRTSFRQAGQALELARRLGESRPLYFPDLSVYRLLVQMEHSPDLSSFLEETLGPLLAHESSAEFVRTLEAFFEHHGNLSQTAEALYLHRNTLAYRLDRIEEILDIDLDAPEARLSVQLALLIQRMSGGRTSDQKP